MTDAPVPSTRDPRWNTLDSPPTFTRHSPPEGTEIVTADQPWPDVVAIDQGFLKHAQGAPGIEVSGDRATVAFTVANGAAEYRLIEIDDARGVGLYERVGNANYVPYRGEE